LHQNPRNLTTDLVKCSLAYIKCITVKNCHQVCVYVSCYHVYFNTEFNLRCFILLMIEHVSVTVLSIHFSWKQSFSVGWFERMCIFILFRKSRKWKVLSISNGNTKRYKWDKIHCHLKSIATEKHLDYDIENMTEKLSFSRKWIWNFIFEKAYQTYTYKLCKNVQALKVLSWHHRIRHSALREFPRVQYFSISFGHRRNIRCNLLSIS
jgi:hypothetical protein